MPAIIRMAFTLSQNPQKAIIATYICFLILTNFTELQLTNIQGSYWVGQMRCGHGPPGQPCIAPSKTD